MDKPTKIDGGTFRGGLFSLLLVLGGLSASGRAQSRPKWIAVTPLQSTKSIPASEGYLDIFTTPNAVVTVTGRESRRLIADRYGKATFEKLKRGTYAFKVELQDYQPEEKKKVAIEPGRPVSFRVDLKPVFSTLVLGMGGQADRDVQISIDRQPISPEQIEVREGKLLVKRLQLDEEVVREIKIEKPYHEGLVLERPIRPGECENFVSVELVPLKGALSLSGNAGARIYLDGEDKGLLGSDGRLRLPGLPPRRYQLRAELFGFADLHCEVTISPGAEETQAEVRLKPVIETAEITQAFRGEIFPVLPKGWQVDQGKSLQMEGAGLTLFKSGTYDQHPFSVYQDSTLIFQVRQWDGGGIGWVTRAVDLRNYYKFELLPPSAPDQPQSYRMVFSLCEEGICRPLSNDLLPMFDEAHLRQGGFRVTVTMKKDQIWHCITTRDGKKRPLGPTYAAPAFARGGMGMSGVVGARSIIDELSLFPETFERTDCQDKSKLQEIR